MCVSPFLSRKHINQSVDQHEQPRVVSSCYFVLKQACKKCALAQRLCSCLGSCRAFPKSLNPAPEKASPEPKNRLSNPKSFCTSVCGSLHRLNRANVGPASHRDDLPQPKLQNLAGGLFLFKALFGGCRHMSSGSPRRRTSDPGKSSRKRSFRKVLARPATNFGKLWSDRQPTCWPKCNLQEMTNQRSQIF